MIDEALSWNGGTVDNPVKYNLDTLPDGTEVYFLKPGKEVLEGEKNPNDMRPVVGSDKTKPSFLDVWSDLTKIAIEDFEAFKVLLVVVYRSAYLLDHLPEGNGYRYRPSGVFKECIDELETKVGSKVDLGVWGLVRFIDLLGWNEDVKYHSHEGRATFTTGKFAGKERVGRINTLLTCIRIPYETSKVERDFRKAEEAHREVDYLPLYALMQQLINSKGICTPRQEDITTWLSPYIYDQGKLTLV